MTISLEWPDALPDTEFNRQFLQGMLDRMAVSYCKYGPLVLAYPDRVDAVGSLQVRLDKYARTGNTEYLMDAANFAMIEFMRPRHPEAHFTPEDSKASPGRKWIGEIDPSQRGNRIERMHD